MWIGKETDMWKKYRVIIQIRERIVGGIPKSTKLIEGWLKSRRMADLVEQTAKEMGDQLDETIKGTWTGFKSDKTGLYLEARCVKALLKEAANVIRKLIKFKGFMRARVAERVMVNPSRIYLGVKKPTGNEERPIQVWAGGRPQSAFKRFDYVERPALQFDLWLLDDGVITEKHLCQLLEYGQQAGLGANRSQGEGKFDVVEFGLLERDSAK